MEGGTRAAIHARRGRLPPIKRSSRSSGIKDNMVISIDIGNRSSLNSARSISWSTLKHSRYTRKTNSRIMGHTFQFSRSAVTNPSLQVEP